MLLFRGKVGTLILLNRIYNFPWVILLAALALTTIGLLGIYSATTDFGDSARTLSKTLVMQIGWLTLALGVMAAALVPDYKWIGRYSYLIYGLAMLLLAVLLTAKFMGGIPHLVEARNHAYRWFQMPGTNLAVQPSELAKIAFVMAMCRYLVYRRDIRRLRGLAVPLLMALLPAALVLRQPDLGTALLFPLVMLLMMFAAGARLRHLAVVVLVIMAIAPLAYLKLAQFQQRRLEVWLMAGPLEDFHLQWKDARLQERSLNSQQRRQMLDNLRSDARTRAYIVADYAKWWTRRHMAWLFGPTNKTQYSHDIFARSADEPLERQFDRARKFVSNWLQGPGYHSWQAKLAVGSGGLTGSGLGRGVQTQNRFLAEAHNDFIFAVIAEEWGLIGAAIVIILYVLILIFGIDVSYSTGDPYGRMLAIGIVGLIVVQAFLNMAITVGLTPVTGLALPMVSYGGSSMLANYLALGLLCNVGLRRRDHLELQPFDVTDKTYPA